ncbi:hypothetical protein QQ045_001789 [Rhodiola kirilowii]
MAVRNTLVKYLRMNAELAPQIGGATAPFGLLYRRCFSDDGRGSFLDKSEVTDINVLIVKNFQKIDPSKMPPQAQFQNYMGLDSLDVVEVVMVLEEEFGCNAPKTKLHICLPELNKCVVHNGDEAIGTVKTCPLELSANSEVN